MSSDGNLLKVDLLGTSFSIRSKESTDHLNEVIDNFKLRIKEIEAELPTADPLKLALIAGLNLVDELLRLQKGRGESYDDSSEIVGKITSDLIERIDQCLDNRDQCLENREV